MDRQTVLPVAPAQQNLLLMDKRGAPIWPYTRASDRALLVHVAQLFGREVEDVSPWSLSLRRANGRLVTGYGDGVERIGRLYAHLTQRRYVQVDSPSAAVGHDAVDVVVCIDRTAPHDLLDELVRAERNTHIGILWARDPASLLRQALIRSAAAVLEPATAGNALVVSPTWGTTQSTQVGQVELRGAVDDPEGLNAAAVLALTTHSDGIDAFLGRQLTLCSLVDLDPKFIAPLPRPKCVMTGECHRQAMPLSEAMASGRLVSARKLAARVLIWNTCFGIMGKPPSVADAWGLLPHLVASANVGCLIALRGIVNTGTSQIVPLVATLQMGASVGQALTTWKQTVDKLAYSMLRDRIFLFGDPAVMANRKPEIGEADATHALEPVSARPVPRILTAEGPVLRRFVADVKLQQPELCARAEECRQAVDSYELEYGSATTLGSYAERAIAFRQSLLGVLSHAMWSTWLDSWIRTATIREELIGKRCHECGGPVWAARFDLRVPGSASRQYSNCASCGAIDDFPEGCEAVVESGEHGLRLVRGGPQRDWSGVLVSVPIGPNLKSKDWPRDADGLPHAECVLTDTGQIGPIFRLAIFIQDWRVSIYMRRAFKEQVEAR